MTDVKSGDKFAIIAMHGSSADLTTPIELGDGLWISKQLPSDISDIQKDAPHDGLAHGVEFADLFLICRRSSGTVNENDLESRANFREVFRLYFGVSVATPGFAMRRATCLAGRMVDAPYIHQAIPLEPLYHSPGTPPHWNFCQTHAHLAKRIADGLLATHPVGEFARLNRVNSALLEALRSKAMDARLHQAVRVLEGLVLPPYPGPTGSKFSERAQLFVGAQHRDLLTDLYKMRGKVEHLHGPLAAVAAVRPELAASEYSVHLAFACFVAENLAKACLTRVYTRPELWNRFENDTALKMFWDLDRPRQQDIWGDHIDLQNIARQFDRETASLSLEQAKREAAVEQNADLLALDWRQRTAPE